MGSRPLSEAFISVSKTLASAVAALGSFTVDYPAGSTAANFDADAPAQGLRVSSARERLNAPAQFAMAFGASEITVTLVGATTLRAGEEVVLSLWRRDITPAVQSGAYPQGATPVANSSGNVANDAAVATLGSDAGKTTYLAGFQCSGAGATVGLPVTVTVAGLLGGTQSYTYAAVAGALIANQPLICNFDPPLPASGEDVDIVVSCPALGVGNTKNSVSAYGYKL